MAKTHGLGATISIDDSGGTPRAIGNGILNYTQATPRGVQDITGVNNSAHERLLLLADLTIGLNGVFNNGVAPSAHDCFKTVPSTSVARTYTMVVGGATMAAEVLFSDYSLNRGNDGSLVWQAPGSLSDGTVPTWA